MKSDGHDSLTTVTISEPLRAALKKSKSGTRFTPMYCSAAA